MDFQTRNSLCRNMDLSKKQDVDNLRSKRFGGYVAEKNRIKSISFFLLDSNAQLIPELLAKPYVKQGLTEF